MPSVNQIKKTKVEPNNVKKPVLPRIIKYIVLVLVGVAVFRYFFALKIVDIPQAVYDSTTPENQFYSMKIVDIPQAVYDSTTPENQFYSIIHGQRKIVWFGADCPISAHRKKIIDKRLKLAGVDKSYEHIPFLVNSYNTSCSGEGCVDIFLIENCGGNFCVVFPNRRKIVKFDFDDVRFIRKLQDMRKW